MLFEDHVEELPLVATHREDASVCRLEVLGKLPQIARERLLFALRPQDPGAVAFVLLLYMFVRVASKFAAAEHDDTQCSWATHAHDF